MDSMVESCIDPITIADKKIGTNHPTFIIAEAGINHNGDITLAKQLIDAAVKIKADAIKFQTYRSNEITIPSTEVPAYIKNQKSASLKQIDLLKKFELSYEDFITLKSYCDKKDIIFLSTPHVMDAVDFLDSMISAYKFGSGDLTNHPMLVHAARKQKPLILSTGMATLSEIQAALSSIRVTGNNQIVLLHCTTQYPCPPQEVNLKALRTLQKHGNCLVGYSDHSLHRMVPVVAVSLGAVLIEKHFTLDRTFLGPDHQASFEPAEFQQMIQDIRAVETILGTDRKEPTSSEKKIMAVVRKSIVAKKNIRKGTILTEDELTFKRPGIGISPAQISSFIGKRAKQDIRKNELLQSHMVEEE